MARFGSCNYDGLKDLRNKLNKFNENEINILNEILKNNISNIILFTSKKKCGAINLAVIKVYN